jgi:hypothetical protein
MTKPRTKNGAGVTFPFEYEKNGRTGRIKKWGNGTFGTYFAFAGKKFRNSFGTFENAFAFLEREFAKLDADRDNSFTRFPISHDVRVYSELEQLLKTHGNGATMREAVDFFLVHNEHKRFSPKTVTASIESFLTQERGRNLSSRQIRTLEGHTRQFDADFGARKIHEIKSSEIAEWLMRPNPNGEMWGSKTRRNIRGSLVAMSLHAQSVNAIPDLGKTEFQKVKNPRKDVKGEVEIYTVEQMQMLLKTAIEADPILIPGIVFGCFQGLRPDEFHAETANRKPLQWEALNLEDKVLHVSGQKVRSKAQREIPLFPVSLAWLKPFLGHCGAIWTMRRAYDDKMVALHKKAGFPRIYDGFRHSFASYRFRELKDLSKLALEMGNSPTEIVSSYKRNVSDGQAAEWFSIMPPADYAERLSRS